MSKHKLKGMVLANHKLHALIYVAIIIIIIIVTDSAKTLHVCVFYIASQK